METTRVTASEFQQAFGSLTDRALEEPITITKDGRDHLVVLSAGEYARLKRQDRQVGRAEELPEEWVQALLQQPARDRSPQAVAARKAFMRQIADEVAAMPVLDPRSAAEIMDDLNTL